MNARTILLALLLAARFPCASGQAVQNTSFTFQGTLQQSGVPLDGLPNLEFRLFDSNSAPVGPILSKPSWPVSNGQLTVDLDFGGIFNGQARYLQITVNGTVLSPLLLISSTPYALAAQTTVANSVNSNSVVNGSLGSIDIDASMQRRVSGTCTAGNAIRVIDAAGAVTCEAVSGGAGDITDVLTAAGSGLTGGGTSGSISLSIPLGGVTNGMIAGNAITSAKIQDGTIWGVDILDENLTGADIMDGSLTGLDILDGSIGSADIQNNSLTSADIQDGAITSADIQDSTILGADILDGSVTGLDILDGSIGGADIQNGSIGQIDINSGEIQRRVASTCAAGSSIRAIAADGTVTCETDDTGVSSAWGLTGNSGTTSAANYIGTSDGAALRIKASAVGVNTTTPLTSLHVTAGAVTVSSGEPDPSTIINAERANGNAFITIMGSTGQQRGLVFGESNNPVEAGVYYDNANLGQMDFRTGGNIARAVLGVSDVDGASLDLSSNLRLRSIEGGAAYWASNGIGEGADFRFGFEGTPPSIIVSAVYGPYFFRPVTVLDDLGVDGGDLTLYTGNGFKPGGGSWAVQSDARLKHHVEPLDNALDHLLALRGVNYEYLPSTSPLRRPGKHVGFIAQEVREVFPEWVGEGKDGYLFVAPTGFEALTVEALRDLKAEQDVEVESLRAANQQMHSELDALRREIDSLRASVVAAARN